MKPLVHSVPKGLTINLDMISIGDMVAILDQNQGYVDGDWKQLVVWCKK